MYRGAEGEGRNMGKWINYANWLIEETCFEEQYTAKWESLFCQGNGYLGVRNALEERYAKEKRNLFVAGTFDKASGGEATELPNLPDVTNMEIEIDGQPFSMLRGRAEHYSRTLNLRTGESVRTLTWTSPGGKTVEFVFRRFVSFHHLHLIGSCVEIKALDGLDVRIKSGIDGQQTNSGTQHLVELCKRLYEETYLEWIGKTTESEVMVSVHSGHRILADGREVVLEKYHTLDERRRLGSCLEFPMQKGQCIRVEKLSVIHTSRDFEYIELETPVPWAQEWTWRLQRQGLGALKEALKTGYDMLFSQSAAVWAKFWEEQDIVIESRDPFDQPAIRFALYHLNIMMRQGDRRIGIGAKGLSGEGYKGHSFWDTETFIFPYFLLARPKDARTLLEYRYLCLPGARAKAREKGFQGAMYPWETAWPEDGEVTPWVLGVDLRTGEPWYCQTGAIEIHITADIIYALWNYYLATGDEEFLEAYGYEMILDTAVFWSHRLEWVEAHDRYEIRDVIGPDENKEHVDNNAYTNYMAAFHMALAVKVLQKGVRKNSAIYERLSALTDLEELEGTLQEMLAKLYLPKPHDKTGIIPQFDGYFDLKDIDLTEYKKATVVETVFRDYSVEELQQMKIGKQADVVELLYQLADVADEETKRKNYVYYEARTLHDSSLSRAIHSLMALDVGLFEEAYQMFQKAAGTDLGEEMKSSDAGIHAANMGGVWQAVVMGFGGVRIKEEQLTIHPKLPKEWTRMSYAIFWQGNRIQVRVQEWQLRIQNEGVAFTAQVAGKEERIESGTNIFSLQ